jgi:hypothetical protein
MSLPRKAPLERWVESLEAPEVILLQRQESRFTVMGVSRTRSSCGGAESQSWLGSSNLTRGLQLDTSKLDNQGSWDLPCWHPQFKP